MVFQVFEKPKTKIEARGLCKCQRIHGFFSFSFFSLCVHSAAASAVIEACASVTAREGTRGAWDKAVESGETKQSPTRIDRSNLSIVASQTRVKINTQQSSQQNIVAHSNSYYYRTKTHILINTLKSSNLK